MADASITLYRGSASTTAGTTLYTTPASIAVSVVNIAVTNTAATSSTYTLNLGGTALLSGTSVAANTTTFISLDQILYNAETITGSASTTAVNFHISGYEVY